MFRIIMLWSLALPLLAACGDEQDPVTPDTGEKSTARVVVQKKKLEVFKSPSCGCCKDWVSHITREGFSAVTRHPSDLNAVKARYAIEPRYQACHTGVSEAGYVFEGHIPARYIAQFLAHPPEDAIGLAVPAMPVGSPGMEAGDRFSPYRVLLLKKDGSSEVYATVDSPGQQYRREPQ